MSNYSYQPASPQAIPSPTTPPAGWYADPQGGSGQRYWDGQAWQFEAAGQWSTQGSLAPAYGYQFPDAAADSTAKGIATYERLSGVAWIVLGIFQILSVVLLIAGVWNIFAGITRLSAAPRIERREASVPLMFQGVAGLVVIGLVNLVFGAVIGIVMVAVDLYVRQRVLDNRHIFNR
jgi:uncharacterized membrane protein